MEETEQRFVMLQGTLVRLS